MNGTSHEAMVKYKVVLNHHRQYSLLPVTVKNPSGWKEVGKEGSKQTCLDYVQAVWTRMTPVGSNKVAEKQHASLKQKSTPKDFCPGDGIHYYFEKRVQKAPDACALIFEDRQLSYRQLNGRANQLANYLTTLGVGPNVSVGLYIERSAEMVIGLLGILKTGGTYVPLDPTYPKARFTFILKDTRISVLVTKERHLDSVGHLKMVKVCLDRDWTDIRRYSEENIICRISENTLSHVIYTSGSTGKPKGVAVSHASLRHNVQTIKDVLGIGCQDIYLHTASIAFTSSLRQLLVPLTAGATTVIASDEQRTNPLALIDVITRHQVTVWDTVAAFFENGLYALDRMADYREQFLSNSKLRLILSSGGELPSDLPMRWLQLAGDNVRLVNMYGQTETIGNILVHPILNKGGTQENVVPIGMPINGVNAYLLDESLQPVLDGRPAELHIDGKSLANGYFNQPGLTAEKFVPHPFSKERGARLYKTGDTARLLPDGTLAYVGRVDFQISISGFRIEPGEIEAALKTHGPIRDAVVTARQDGAGDKRLVAYLVPWEKDGLRIDALQHMLRTKLPVYMIPSVFVFLNALPRLPNGKLDRNNLPEPEWKRTHLSRPYLAPRGELQRFISNLWCDILKLDRIGGDDKFFELGGNSLLAARFVNKVQHELGVFIPIVSLFEAPTVKSYAVLLKRRYPEAVTAKFPQVPILPDNIPTKLKGGPTRSSKTMRNQQAYRQRMLRQAHRNRA